MTAPVPSFYLYGEPQRSVAEGFVHVESLDDRSRPSEWTIQPHLHRDLNHIILIAEGGGSMRADGDSVGFDAPCLLLVPAGIIHGFSWHRDSRGWVITVADSYLHHLLERDADLQPLFRAPRAVALPGAAEVETRIGALARELAWAGPGQRAAVDALLLWLMVQALRHATLSGASASSSDRQARLVARLRERIEQRFRHREPVADHARALGVSETALRHACARAAGLSPAAMLDERAVLEARRLLLYSNLSVAEVGYAVGFDDPAYFSRFFARHTGRSPRDWRAARGQAISPS
ncbi:helix-turn-helix domain-containing protein [Sphingomonadales bacterium 56]|uniref:helix-turn-helix domain-containing protein n=1 Tax=unclassified Sphingobium TaxID=2611147 RepID=UPI0019188428|nr:MULTISPECIES: helix-turn-helix domain-containing protein [unclassified Sphingobium]MBY2929726.1 helix-turn-helix domain-containing protein [Sphingomonadales bacterium 56]MBY2960091.1 helix-turn-helix domain-containing protein [Sphingomonadales bacterium 58]CAD7340067.1 Arabinose operon regulatory protein [Sphingobium sp. S6]CAD7340357.1 Arabinose operon regulatory protein [Sphingobium sp. S8]